MNPKYIPPVIIFFSAILFFTGNVQAGFSSDCAPCHGKLGLFTSPHTDEDCKSCHNWEERHILPGICSKCHFSNIHETHKDRAGCNLCHDPAKNWSSPRVKIPYGGSNDTGNIIIPPSNECTFCHSIDTGGNSLHEIHGSNLKSICSKCHVTEMNQQSITTITKIMDIKKTSDPEITILEDFSRLFNRIAIIIASISGG